MPLNPAAVYLLWLFCPFFSYLDQLCDEATLPQRELSAPLYTVSQLPSHLPISYPVQTTTVLGIYQGYC